MPDQPKTVTLKHSAGRPSFGSNYHSEVLEQAIRNIAPNMSVTNPADFHYMHPNVRRMVDREYARLLEVMR